MAERTLTVQLRALVQGYTANMAKAAAATGPLEKSLARTQRAGVAMSRIGDKLTTRVSLPLAAVGAASVKMAMDFDSSMSKIVGLVGLSRTEVDGMREDVLALSGETTKSPQELADALFTITSAGLRGGEAMDVLEASAKASAAGLGDTRAIAEAVTASVNTYGSETLDAARATDIFVATARAGNFATEELTGAMGKVLPFANAAGASLEDVGGAVALLTRSNNDANESITNTAALFRAFVRPSQQAIDILDEVGLTAQDVRDSMGENGLVATLQMLDGALGGNREQLGRIIEDSTGFAAAIQILDADASTINSTFGQVEDSVGLLDEAFAAFESSAVADAQRALANLQTALIQVGNVLLPVASDIANFVATVFDGFTKLPKPVQEGAVWVGVFVAAIGPLLSIGGRLVTTFSRMASAITNFAAPAGMMAGRLDDTAVSSGRTRGSMSRLGGVLGGLTAAIGLAAVAWEIYGNEQEKQRRRAKEFSDALSDTNGDLQEASEQVVSTSDEWDGLRRVIADSGRDLDEFTEFIDGSVGPMEEAAAAFRMFARGSDEVQFEQMVEDGNEFAELLQDLAENSNLSNAEIVSLAEGLIRANEAGAEGMEMFEALDHAQEGTSESSSEAAAAMEELGVEISGTAEEFESAAEAAQAYNDALSALFDPLFGVLDAVDANREASRGLTEAQNALNEAIKEHGPNSAEAAEAERNLEQAHRDSAGSALSLEMAERELAAAMADGTVSADEAKASLSRWVDQGRITQGTADEIARRIDNTTFSLEDMAGNYRANVSESGSSNVTFQAREMAGVLDEATRDRNVHISVTQTVTSTFAAREGSIYGGRRQHGGPITPNDIYMVGEAGPELFVSDRAGSILANHDLGQARPAMAAMGGGTNVTVAVDMRGAIVSSASDAERWVAQAWNRAAGHGRLNLRGARIRG